MFVFLISFSFQYTATSANQKMQNLKKMKQVTNRESILHGAKIFRDRIIANQGQQLKERGGSFAFVNVNSNNPVCVWSMARLISLGVIEVTPSGEPRKAILRRLA